jgi:hypothetical protein
MATTPTIMVQKLGPNNDPVEQNGASVFLTDIDAVAQIILTRLRLLLGEWWEDLSIGFPLFQSLIATSGSSQNQKTVMALIQQTITTSPFVLGIVSFSYTFTSGGRATKFVCVVNTSFGTLTVTNAPGSSAQVTN